VAFEINFDFEFVRIVRIKHVIMNTEVSFTMEFINRSFVSKTIGNIENMSRN